MEIENKIITEKVFYNNLEIIFKEDINFFFFIFLN